MTTTPQFEAFQNAIKAALDNYIHSLETPNFCSTCGKHSPDCLGTVFCGECRKNDVLSAVQYSNIVKQAALKRVVDTIVKENDMHEEHIFNKKMSIRH
jgi:hypothetical protein